MNDPLHDPRFPDRPDTPDFWRLSETVLEQDGRSVEGGEDPFTIADVDQKSITYMARHRVAMAFGGAPIPTNVLTTIIALYVDAFTVGRGFEKRGGHRD